MSSTEKNHDLHEVASLFDLRGDLVFGHPYGSGHINDTYCAYYDQAGIRIRYIHQRINHNIFKDPAALMENISRVTEHALKRLLEQGDKEAHRRTLTCIPALTGKSYAIDSQGNFWRTYLFIERARTYDILETPNQAREAARAFGEFQKLGADLPGAPLTETIPDFHHTAKRFDKLLAAISNDSQNRAANVKTEIDWFLQRQNDAKIVVNALESGEIPVRVTHNDTKLNNVMLDDVTGEAVCVIDLDTTMPGSAIYDFGDMVRTATSPAAEDEVDTSKIDCRENFFEALVSGYLSSAGEFLTDRERDLLAFSGKLLTLECGSRFLTDYLEGDVYFKTHRKDHNLDRCRSQIALVEAIEGKMTTLEAIVAKY